MSTLDGVDRRWPIAIFLGQLFGLSLSIRKTRNFSKHDFFLVDLRLVHQYYVMLLTISRQRSNSMGSCNFKILAYTETLPFGGKSD